MTVSITTDPGPVVLGERRKYGVEVTGDDWPAFTELVEELTGDQVTVIVDDTALKFETIRERLSWADGCRHGYKVAANATTLVDWLEAWLLEQIEMDPMEKEGAARRVAVYAEGMSPQTHARGVRLVQALTRWRKS